LPFPSEEAVCWCVHSRRAIIQSAIVIFKTGVRQSGFIQSTLDQASCPAGDYAMQKKTLVVVGVALIAVSTIQAAAASERGHARKMVRPAASEQFRNANNAMVRTSQPGWYSGYDGALSAPAGR
jgi:hypothetical protein